MQKKRDLCRLTFMKNKKRKKVGNKCVHVLESGFLKKEK
jgi:hypothetical protein